MFQTISAQTAAAFHGTGIDLGLPAPGSTVTGAVPGTTPMPRAYPVGVAVTSGTITGGTVQLEGSLDGAVWYPVGSVVSLGTGGTFALPSPSTPVPARYVRASIVAAVTGGGNVSVWVDAAP